MSRKLTVLLLALLVLVGAMGLKTAVMAQSSTSAVMMANGPAPFPPSLNGPAPFPPSVNGPAPFPPAASVSSR